jgi:hypothetical protein
MLSALRTLMVILLPWPSMAFENSYKLRTEGCRTFSAPLFYYAQSPGLRPGLGYHAPLALYSKIIIGNGYNSSRCMVMFGNFCG